MVEYKTQNLDADENFFIAARTILNEKNWYETRPIYNDGTKAKTKSIYGYSDTYNLQEGLPISSLRKISYKLALDEILWIWQKKSNNIMDLKSHVWDEWATMDNKGGRTIGKAYGYQMAKEVYKNPLPSVFGDREKINRVEMLFYNLVFDQMSRRMVVNMYDDNDLDEMNLAPCAFMTMWDFTPERGLSVSLIQRSGDFLVAAHPGGWNLVQYSLLTYIIAYCVGIRPGSITHFINNLHIYDRHEDGVRLLANKYERRSINKSIQLSNRILTLESKPNVFDSNEERLRNALELFENFDPRQIYLSGYDWENDLKNIPIAK